MQPTGHSYSKRLLLWIRPQKHHIRIPTMLCSIPRCLLGLPDPHSLLGITLQLGQNIRDIRNSRSHRLCNTWTLSYTYLHEPQTHLIHTTLKLVDKIPIPASNHQPAFLQCVRHSKFGSIFGISIPELSTNWYNFFNMVTHYIHAKLIELRAEDLSYRFLTSDSISEVNQYDFNIEDLTVSPKHAEIPSNE